MASKILVIDDDINLVADLRRYCHRMAPEMTIVGPPDLLLDLPAIRENTTGSAAIVLDLKISGSDTFGRNILRKLSRRLSSERVPVIIWSKYLVDTIIEDGNGFRRLIEDTQGRTEWSQVTASDLQGLGDAERIQDLRKVYPGAVAFVQKATGEPIKVLARVLEELDVIGTRIPQ